MNKKAKNKQLKNKNGITLIALVVTIIVLIILAGVSINLVLGDNGILKKASMSKEQMKIERIKEEIQFWKASEEIARQTGSERTQGVKEFIESLGPNGQNLLTQEEVEQVIGNEEKGIEPTYTLILGDETISFKEINAEEISKNPTLYYGATVKNYTCPNNEAVENWKIFYADENNIYLIADDYIKFEDVPKKDNVEVEKQR